MITLTEPQLSVQLMHHTPLALAIKAIRNCYDSEHLSDTITKVTNNDYPDELNPKDTSLINRIIESKHESTLEHIYYNFFIDGLSRAALQELARHRIASLSVKSTRYTLKKELREVDIINLKDIAHKYIKLESTIEINPTTNIETYHIDPTTPNNSARIEALRYLIANIKASDPTNELSTDRIKYILPEALLTKLTWSINARSLRNFLNLRLSKSALKEMQELSMALLLAIPQSHRDTIFQDTIINHKIKEAIDIKVKAKLDLEYNQALADYIRYRK